MWRKSDLLDIGYQSVISRVGFNGLPSGSLDVRKGQVQSYEGKHCSLVGIQYINIKTKGLLRASALTKYSHQRKKQKQMKK